MVARASRKKLIVIIIAAWVVIFSFIFISSEYIFQSSFSHLEKSSAIEANNRAYNVILNSLNYISILNVDYAYWDDTAKFADSPYESYIRSNLSQEFFTDNKLNLVIVFNRKNKVVWSKSFNLNNNQYQPIHEAVIDYFRNHARYMLKYDSKFNNLVTGDHGLGGFVQFPGSKTINYVVFNSIHYQSSYEDHIGVLVFSRSLSAKYISELGKEFNYQLSLFTLTRMSNNQQGKDVLEKLKWMPVYVKKLNDNMLVSYRLIKDFDHRPIGVMKLDFPRKLFIESEKNSYFYQLLLLAVSVLAIFVMSYLVHWFFSKQEKVTASFERFVPHDMLSLLDKSNILDVKLGNSTEIPLAVMFLDIRNFTRISEQLTPKENFEFINRMLEGITPIVIGNHGYIDNYMGDAIMVIFSRPAQHADDAVNAALEIHEKLDEFNQRNEFKFQDPVRVGIGINTGSIRLGVIGSEERMSGTILGDSVNVASRLEDLTKKYKHPILISEVCLADINDKDSFETEYVADVQVKGKTVSTVIYTIKRKES